MKVIRLIGLAIMIGLALVAWLVIYFLVDRWVSSSVEDYGGTANGATVSLDSATIQWFEGELSLNNLAAADPSNLMKNRVEFEQLDFDVSLLALLKGQLHADNLVIRNIALQSDRSQAAEIIKRPNAKDLVGWEYSQAIIDDVKDVDPVDVLSGADIKSPALYQQFAQDLDSTQAEWQKLRDQLPTKDDLERHKNNYNAAKKALKGAKGLKKIPAAKELKKVISEIKRDRAKLDSFRKKVSQDISELKQEWKVIQKQVSKDADLAMSVASLSPEGLRHVAATLLGEDMAGWLELAVSNIGMAQGMLSSKESSDESSSEQPKETAAVLRRGKDYSFDENPLPPDLWIKNSEISGEIRILEKLGNIKGTAKNIADQLLPGRPMEIAVTFTLPEQNSEKLAGGSLNTLIEYPDRLENRDRSPLTGKVRLNQWPIEQWSLASNAIRLNGARMNLQGEFSASATDAMVTAQVQLSGFTVAQDQVSGSGITQQLAKVLNTTSIINLGLKLVQKDGKLSVNLSSNLDEQLYKSIKAQATQKIKLAKQKVEQQIQAQVAESTQKIEEKLAGLIDINSLLSKEVDLLSQYN